MIEDEPKLEVAHLHLTIYWLIFPNFDDIFLQMFLDLSLKFCFLVFLIEVVSYQAVAFVCWALDFLLKFDE